MKTEQTKVIFRKYKNGDIIALFPQIPEDINGIYCMSYMHVGQHGGADYGDVIYMTTPAAPDEYKSLKTELESIGYDLDIKQKSGRKDYEILQQAAKS